MQQSRQPARVRTTLIVGAFAATLAPANLTHAAVSLDSRYSEVFADAKAFGIEIFGEDDGPYDSDIDSSTSFDDFAGRSASAHSESSFSTEADGYGWQSSSFTLDGADLRSATARGEMTADGLTSSGGFALSSGYSEFTFSFTVTGAPAPYTLTGSLTSNQQGAILLYLYNDADPSTDIHAFENDATLDVSGVLQPGTYWFELSGYVSAATEDVEHATGAFNVTLAFPTAQIPGDANGDGVVDADDLARIDRGAAMNLTGYANGDFNNDNTIDAADYAIIYDALATPSSPAAAFPVPEPATLSLFLALAPLSQRRRR